MAIKSNQSVVLMDASGRSVEYARLQMRRGLESQFDASKMLPAEFAVTTDTKKAYLAFAAGDVKRLSTYEDMTQDLADALAEIEQEYLGQISTATAQAQAATSAANTATQSANTATDNANAAADEARKTIWNNKNLTNSTSASESQVNTAAGAAVLTGVDGKTLQDGTPTPDVPIPVRGVGGETGDESFGFNAAIQSYQLFDASKLPTKSAGGGTVTNNGDGTFTVSGSGTFTSTFLLDYSFTHEETVKLIKSGKIELISDIGKYPYYGMTGGINGKPQGTFEINSVSSDRSSFDITDELLNDDSFVIRIFIYCYTGGNIDQRIIKPMIYQNGDGTFQKYHRSELPITLTQPLFDGDKIMQVKAGQTYVDEDGATQTADRDLLGIYRNNIIKKILSSDVTRDTLNPLEKSKEIRILNFGMNKNGNDIKLYSNRFVKVYTTWDDDRIGIFSTAGESYGEIAFRLPLSEDKTWFDSHDTWVVVESRFPYFEPFADQAPFFAWTTPTGGCTITTDDPLEPIISADTAQTPEGSYLLTGYVEGLRARTLEQRIEQLVELTKI